MARTSRSLWSGRVSIWILVAISLLTVLAARVLLRDPLRVALARFELGRYGGTRFTFDVDSGGSQRADVLARAGRIVATRLERFTGQPVVQRVEGNHILVDMPRSSADRLRPAAIEALLARGNLEFRMVDDDDASLARLKEPLPEGITLDWDTYVGAGDKAVTSPFLRSKDRNRLQGFLKDKAPRGRELAISRAARSTADTYRTFLLDQKPGLTGDHVADARVAFESESGKETRPYVQITFDHGGAAIFGKLTSDNVKRRMAIVLDGTVDSAPIVQTEITGGICSIHLAENKTVVEALQEAKDLSLLLKVGALPAPVRLVSARELAPAWKR